MEVIIGLVEVHDPLTIDAKKPQVDRTEPVAMRLYASALVSARPRASTSARAALVASNQSDGGAKAEESVVTRRNASAPSLLAAVRPRRARGRTLRASRRPFAR